MINTSTDMPKIVFEQEKICDGYVVGGEVFWFDKPKTLSEYSCEYCQGKEVGSCLLNDGSVNAFKRVAFCHKSSCLRPRTAGKAPQKATKVTNWEGFGIPETYLSKDLDNYIFKSEKTKHACLEFISGNTEKLWFLTGEVRAGKTHLALGMLKKFREMTSQGILFITHSELYFMIKEAMKNNQEQELLSKMANIPFLVLDDLGVLRGTPMELDITYELLARRFNKNVKTIITTNRSEAEINEMYGPRLMGRIAEAGKIHKFTRPSESTKVQLLHQNDPIHQSVKEN